MDLAFRTLDRVPAAVKGQVFTANYDHHVEPAEARSLPLFMDAHLKGDGRPVAGDAAGRDRCAVTGCRSSAWPRRTRTGSSGWTSTTA